MTGKIQSNALNPGFYTERYYFIYTLDFAATPMFVTSGNQVMEFNRNNVIVADDSSI